MKLKDEQKNIFSQSVSNFSDKFLTIILIISILISFFALTQIVTKINITKNFYIFCLALSICNFIFVFFALNRFNANLKFSISLAFLVILFFIYSFEIYFQLFKKNPVEVTAKKYGIDFDDRTKKEVLNDLSKENENVFPSINPNIFVGSNGLKFNGEKTIFPLGTVSESITILSNEAGFYPIIKTDEHGFHNPKNLYVEDKIDLALIGDSFVEGYSVNSENNISSLLRKSNYETINLGKASNGPLIELAILKEYALPIRPKTVLWFYFAENDMGDLTHELNSDFLKQYLTKKNYSQKLISKQREIDQSLINFITLRTINAEISNFQKLKNKVLKTIKLDSLRTIFNLKPNYVQLSTLSEILDLSNRTVQSWGGKFYFVYLPARGHTHFLREELIDMVKNLKIPIIDLKKEVFDINPDPKSLYPLRLYSHYNEKGYKLVSDRILERLKKDNILPK